jgi:PTS system nitrogen regulatory IIA component
MELKDILAPSRIAQGALATSKKRAIELVSKLLAAGDELVANDVFESLINRERLGTTALGHGVALPHGRLKNGERTLGAFVQLANGVDFDAADRKPVDLLFAIVVPEESTEEHLQLLAKIAEMFSDETMRARLRHAASVDELQRLLLQWIPSRAP